MFHLFLEKYLENKTGTKKLAIAKEKELLTPKTEA